MKNLSDRKRSDNKKVLLIGDSGSGKTSFLATIPDLYIADFDNGLDVLSGKKIDYDEYFEGDGKPTAWKNFKTLVDGWRKAGNAPKAVALDSITTAGEAALRYTLDKNGHSSANITQPDWGQAINEVKDMLAKLTTLPVHVIITAHYQMVRDDVAGQTFFVPLIYGKELPVLMPKFFNDCWRTYVDIPLGAAEPKYQLQVRPSSKFSTLKNSLGIKELYHEPHWGKMMEGK